jgi:hypothetical protein
VPRTVRIPKTTRIATTVTRRGRRRVVDVVLICLSVPDLTATFPVRAAGEVGASEA